MRRSAFAFPVAAPNPTPRAVNIENIGAVATRADSPPEGYTGALSHRMYWQTLYTCERLLIVRMYERGDARIGDADFDIRMAVIEGRPRLGLGAPHVRSEVPPGFVEVARRYGFDPAALEAEARRLECVDQPRGRAVAQGADDAAPGAGVDALFYG